MLESSFNSGYWTGYSIPPMLPNYDPYLTSGHLDYPHHDHSASAPPYHYYPQDQDSASNVLETDTMTASNTTEDITFAEAFTALANYDPQQEPEVDNPAHSDQGKIQNSNQHIETFNEISLGRF